MDLGPIEQPPQPAPRPMDEELADIVPAERPAQRALREHLQEQPKRFITDIDLPHQDRMLRDMQRKILQEHRQKKQQDGGLAPIPKNWGIQQ